MGLFPIAPLMLENEALSLNCVKYFSPRNNVSKLRLFCCLWSDHFWSVLSTNNLYCHLSWRNLNLQNLIFCPPRLVFVSSLISPLTVLCLGLRLCVCCGSVVKLTSGLSEAFPSRAGQLSQFCRGACLALGKLSLCLMIASFFFFYEAGDAVLFVFWWKKLALFHLRFN